MTLTRTAETMRGRSCKAGVRPFDRLFEAARGEMSGSNITGVEKAIRIERAQTARPFSGFDRRLGLVARRVDKSSNRTGASRVWVERQDAVESRRRHRRLSGEDKQRAGSLANRLGVIAPSFERQAGQAAGLDDVVSR